MQLRSCLMHVDIINDPDFVCGGTSPSTAMVLRPLPCTTEKNIATAAIVRHLNALMCGTFHYFFSEFLALKGRITKCPDLSRRKNWYWENAVYSMDGPVVRGTMSSSQAADDMRQILDTMQRYFYTIINCHSCVSLLLTVKYSSIH